MKKYAFPFTLALVCFIGGYVTCHSKMTAAHQAWQSNANEDLSKHTASLRTARVDAMKHSPLVLYAFPSGRWARLAGWNQGLIAPMIPPKVVAP